MAIQMRRGNLADFDPTKMMPGEFAVTLDTDNNLNKRVFITFAAGTVKQLMTVEDATAQMIEATDAATAEAEAWAHGNSFTATEMFTSAGSATVTLAYSPSSINAVKINDVATTAYTRNGKVITFNTAPAVGSIITVIYGVSTSTDNAKYYKEQADTSATSAATNAVAAESYAVGGTGSRTGEDTDNAKYYKEQADLSADDADDYAILAESYAVGGTGTRPGEDSDNAEYYYEQARDISQSLTGALKPCGTVTYVNLPSLSVALAGDMYNVSDAFTTTNDFKEGAGHHIAAGANVYKTSDSKWDILAGVTVTGVKGDKETNYRLGNVNLTPANVGAVAISEQYAECSTARNVAAKTVTLPGFKLEAGARISVRFTDTGSSNPASGNITLNVNGTGAKEVVDSHTNMTKMTYTSNWFYNNLVNDFVYDGTYWVWMNRDNNTTYSSKAAASGGTATSLCTTGEKYTWNNKQNALTFDNVPTQNSNNPVKSGGIFSTMGVPRVDTANRRMYLEGGAAFDGNIDSSPTAGSNNAVASGGTKTYVDNAVSNKAKTLLISNTSFSLDSNLAVGETANVIVEDSSLCIAFAGDSNPLSGTVARLANAVYAWHLATYNYKFIYVRTNSSFTVSRRYYAAGTSF